MCSTYFISLFIRNQLNFEPISYPTHQAKRSLSGISQPALFLGMWEGLGGANCNPRRHWGWIMDNQLIVVTMTTSAIWCPWCFLAWWLSCFKFILRDDGSLVKVRTLARSIHPALGLLATIFFSRLKDIFPTQTSEHFSPPHQLSKALPCYQSPSRCSNILPTCSDWSEGHDLKHKT